MLLKSKKNREEQRRTEKRSKMGHRTSVCGWIWIIMIKYCYMKHIRMINMKKKMFLEGKSINNYE